MDRLTCNTTADFDQLCKINMSRYVLFSQIFIRKLIGLMT